MTPGEQGQDNTTKTKPKPGTNPAFLLEKKGDCYCNLSFFVLYYVRTLDNPTQELSKGEIDGELQQLQA